ncbi:alanine--tRNA ligase-related protein, partial [Klebsiella variicola]
IVTAILRDGKVVDDAREGDSVAIIVNQTPFYGESGGQMGDTGTISGEGFRIEVTDTLKKADGLFVHQGKVTKGSLKTGAAVELEVD